MLPESREKTFCPISALCSSVFGTTSLIVVNYAVSGDILVLCECAKIGLNDHSMRFFLCLHGQQFFGSQIGSCRVRQVYLGKSRETSRKHLPFHMYNPWRDLDPHGFQILGRRAGFLNTQENSQLNPVEACTDKKLSIESGDPASFDFASSTAQIA